MTAQQREIWFDGRAIEDMDIWGLVNHSPLTKMIVTREQRNADFFPQKTVFVTEITSLQDLEGLPASDIIFSDRMELLDAAKQRGYTTCAYFTCNDKDEMNACWHTAMNYDNAAVDFDLPTNIPLELIIARLDHTNTVLLRHVRSAVEARVAFGTLEKGSDGVMFTGSDTDEIIKLVEYMGEEESPKLELHELVVTHVEHAGMGVRACVDTTGIMTQDEGMIIGSTSGGGIFVCSETHYLPYMNLRPFRVNAGAIHSYVWMPENEAEYLSDLRVGSKVLCVNTKGETRVLTVGRIKTEVRPMLLIKGLVGERELNVIVQDDWHIRVMGADSKPRNASQIRPGEKLLAYLCEPGRHVGIKVNETIIER